MIRILSVRASVLVLLALAACRGASVPAADAAQVDAARTRAQAAGLTKAQAAEMESLGVPVYVPNLPAGWTLAEMTSDAKVLGDLSFLRAEYTLRYTTPSGACLTLEAASVGQGIVFPGGLPSDRAVDVPGVPPSGPVRLGWSAPGEGADGWAGGRVATEWFGIDNLTLRLDTDTGCPPPALDDAEALLASLRPLDAADDAILIGPLHTSPRMDDGPPPNDAPEDAARIAFSSTSSEGRQATTVETLRRRDAYAVMLVTTSYGAGDSVRETRTWAVLVLDNAMWHVASDGRQWRCQPGRGHTDWGAELCS